MNATHFDLLTRGVGAAPSRRRVLAALFLGSGSLSSLPKPGAAGPGCKNAGKKCKKKKDCCSGVCKGKKDKKICKAHGTGGCQAGEQTGGCGGANRTCTTSAGEDGFCETTAGNAGYCSGSGLICTPCQRDADCRDFCGPDAACIQCVEGCGMFDTACVGPVECS